MGSLHIQGLGRARADCTAAFSACAGRLYQRHAWPLEGSTKECKSRAGREWLFEDRLAGEKSRYTLESQAHHSTIAQHNDALRKFSAQFQAFIRRVRLGMGSKNKELYPADLKDIFKRIHELLRNHLSADWEISAWPIRWDI